MLTDEEFSGLVPSTEHYQPQVGRVRPHRKVIELNISALDISSSKAATIHSSKADEGSIEKPTIAKPLESKRSTGFASVSQDLSFQESPLDDKQSDHTIGERHLSTDHYSPCFTSVPSGRAKLSSVDLNVPENVTVTKQGVCTEISASQVEKEIRSNKNTEMPCFTDDLISSKQESADQDQLVQQKVKSVASELQSSPPVQVCKKGEGTTSRVENKSGEDVTVDRIDKISVREVTTELAEGKVSDQKPTILTADKLAEKKPTVDAVEKLAKEKLTFGAVDKLDEDKPTFGAVENSTKEKLTFGAVDKLDEDKPTFGAVEKSTKEKPTFGAVDKLDEDKPTVAAVEKSSVEKPTSTVEKPADEKPTVTTVDRSSEEKATFAAAEKLAEGKQTFGAVDRSSEEKATFVAAAEKLAKLAEGKPTFGAVDKSAKEKPTSLVERPAEEKSTVTTVDRSSEEKSTFDVVDKSSEEKATFAAAEKSADGKSTSAAVDKSAKEKPTFSAVDKLGEEKLTAAADENLQKVEITVSSVEKLTKEKPTASAEEELEENGATVAAVEKFAEEKPTIQTEEISLGDKISDKTVDELAAKKRPDQAKGKFSRKVATPFKDKVAGKNIPEVETTVSSVENLTKEKPTASGDLEVLEENRTTVAAVEKFAEEKRIPEISLGDKTSEKTADTLAAKKKPDQTKGKFSRKVATPLKDVVAENKATDQAEEKLAKGAEEKLTEAAAAVSDDLILEKSHSVDRQEKVALGGGIDEADQHLLGYEATEEIVSSVVHKDLGTGVRTCETRQENIDVQSALSVTDTSTAGTDTASLLNQEFILRSGDQKDEDVVLTSEVATEKQKKGKKGKKQGKGSDGKGDSVLKEDEQPSGDLAKGSKDSSPVVVKSAEETKTKQQKKGKGKEKENKTTDKSTGHSVGGGGSVPLEKVTEPPVSKTEVQTKQKKGKRSKKNKENESEIAEKTNDENSCPGEENVALEEHQHKHDHTCLIKGHHGEKPLLGKKDNSLRATETTLTTKTSNKTVTIEDLSDDESDDHASVGEEEEHKAPPSDQSTKASKGGDDILSPNVSRQRQSRSEKKARKALSKMGLKQVHGVTQITMKRTKNVMFTIENPDVFKNPGSETYIIFGEARIDDLEERSKSAAADKFRRTEAAEAAKVLQETKAEELVVSEQPESEEELDESGVEPNDIELVMSQAGVSRSKAIKALRDNRNDIVNAIMALTM